MEKMQFSNSEKEFSIISNVNTNLATNLFKLYLLIHKVLMYVHQKYNVFSC